MAGEEPDVVVGCVGGGSNFAGLAFPWLRRKLRDGRDDALRRRRAGGLPDADRRASTRYDFGDTAGLTPLMPMYTLGHDFVPPPVHAGGLRYHGDSPLAVRRSSSDGLVEARAYRQNETFDAGAAVRAHRGDHPGARARPRDPRGRSTRREAAQARPARSG